MKKKKNKKAYNVEPVVKKKEDTAFISDKCGKKRLKPSFWVAVALIVFWTVSSVLSLYLGVSSCIATKEAKADDVNISSDVDFSVINYPTVNVSYSPALTNDYILEGIKFSYDKNVNAIVLSGTLTNTGSNRYYWDFTDFFNYIPDSIYSCYIYSSCNAQDIKVYSNEVSLSNDLFVNKFFKFTGRDVPVKFGLNFPGVYTDGYFDGYYTFMCWQGDWELNSEIVNSLSYQIGYNEGKIIGYQNGYDIGAMDGYNKGMDDGLSSNVSNNYIFNYLKDWSCLVRYGESSSNNRGTFNLTSDNTSIYASGYYSLIKNDTFDNSSPYWLLFNSTTDSKKFTFGYKDLIFKGLPENTCFYVTLNIDGKDYTSFCWLGKDGKWFSYDSIFTSGIYEDNTYLKSFIIECKTAIFTNGEQTSSTIFDLRNYPNFVITADESMVVSSSYQNGYNKAKDYYYNLWYLNRYEQGRQAGVESAGKYTWLGLFGSIIDAPITAVRGLLNFDLLGFNMFNAFSALVTVAIIIAIIRMVL